MEKKLKKNKISDKLKKKKKLSFGRVQPVRGFAGRLKERGRGNRGVVLRLWF